MTEFLETLSALEIVFLVASLGGGLILLAWAIWLVVVEALRPKMDVKEVPTEIPAKEGAANVLVGWLFQGVVGFILMFGVVGLALSRLMVVGDVWSLVGGLAVGGVAVWTIRVLGTQ